MTLVLVNAEFVVLLKDTLIYIVFYFVVDTVRSNTSAGYAVAVI